MVGTSKNPPLRKENTSTNHPMFTAAIPKMQFGSNSKFLSNVVDFQIVQPLVFGDWKQTLPQKAIHVPTIQEFRCDFSFRDFVVICCCISRRIHGTGTFTYLYHKNQSNVYHTWILWPSVYPASAPNKIPNPIHPHPIHQQEPTYRRGTQLSPMVL